MKVTVVGCGISGITAAVQLRRAGHEVEIFETRGHVGGNCHDRVEGGVTVHEYGPHLFHTDRREVWDFLSEFTAFTDYRHRVVADTALGRLSIPYSAITEEQIGRRLEDGEIVELIFRDYSRKQWGVEWDELPDSIRNRVPARRQDADDRYFTDRFQGQPADGFTPMFERMLEGIPVHLGAEPEAWRRHAGELVVYTGKIDAFYGYRFGRLPYRSLRFDHRRSAGRLPHAVINQCNDLPHTRIYDHSWWLDQRPERTVITTETPCAHDEGNIPYYPLPFGAGKAIYAQYRALAAKDASVMMLGRLATYSYLDMWMAVAQAMTKTRPVLA